MKARLRKNRIKRTKPLPIDALAPRFRRDPERHTELAVATREAERNLADKVERGEPLTYTDRRVIATVLRAHADAVPLIAPKSRGHQPEIQGASAALRWAWLRHYKGMSEIGAIEKVAEEYEKSVTAIKKHLVQHGAWAELQFARDVRRTRDLAAEKRLRDLLRAARSTSPR